MGNAHLDLEFSTEVWSLLPLKIKVLSIICPLHGILDVSSVNGTLLCMLGIRLISQSIVQRISCVGT